MRPAPPRRCGCFVPPPLLAALGTCHHLKPRAPKLFAESFAETQNLGASRAGQLSGAIPPPTDIPEADLARATAHLFDCANLTTLPGAPVDAAAAAAAPFAAIAGTTADVRRFYSTVLGRDSIDNRGMPIISSVNYGQGFQNAFWSGQLMVYGNGDQHVFLDFWAAPDVICHEITHGMTQHESALVYEGESGAVNESISDCIAAVFTQWLANTPAADPAGWRLGGRILGPAAIAAGYTCLRDMVSPTATHCLTKQPSLYPNKDPNGDVHLNSGIPNRAFALFARAAGGNAWEAPIRIWYAACTAQGLTSNATIADFAAATLRAADAWDGPDKDALTAALRGAWTTVMVAV